MSNMLYHCGLRCCLVCGSRRDYESLAAYFMRRALETSTSARRERQAERLRRLPCGSSMQ